MEGEVLAPNRRGRACDLWCLVPAAEDKNTPWGVSKNMLQALGAFGVGRLFACLGHIRNSASGYCKLVLCVVHCAPLLTLHVTLAEQAVQLVDSEDSESIGGDDDGNGRLVGREYV